MQLPKEFDFKSLINTEVDRYHAKEMPQGYYRVTTYHDGYSWNFTKEEMENKITNNVYIILGDEHLMENYICINGKKAELTEEQMKALGIELPKANPFARVCNKANDFYHYYFITSYGTITETVDHGFENGAGNDDLRYRNANYCTDEALLRQRALYETIVRLLWRYSMEHDGNKIQPNNCWTIMHSNGVYEAKNVWGHSIGRVHFYTREIAKAAITEIIEPFMKAHPEFKW